VVGFIGSDRLQVQNDAGTTYRVQYIGVRGPVRSSVLHADASAFHGSLVIGQRVLLESDGKDEDGGYKLRHAYLDGNPVPIGAMVVSAGWATAVPYPVEHRHRALYLQLEEQAMAQGIALWQPGVFGPVAPWRPAGSEEAGYVPADPELHRFLDLLYSVPTGQSILNRLVRLAPVVQYRDLREGAGGYASPLGFEIVMSRKVGVADPRSMAAAIAHEGTHAIDFVAGAMDLANYSCFEMEQRSHGVQAQVWSEFFGPGGKPDPQDDWDRSTNNVLRFYQRSDLQNYVQRSAGYEIQCSRERVAG
jgi:endonuclease YncB( thermonuclease family)